MPGIIAENEWLLVVDKPAGLIVHSDGRTDESTLADWLISNYPYLARVAPPWVSPQGRAYTIGGTVHRLDRTTSGIIIVAKTPESYTYLKGEFKARRIDKVYRAYVSGKLEGEGNIIAAIERTRLAPKRWYANPCDETDIRAAITKWRSCEIFKEATYIEARPLTGRTHQIRVHLASIWNPLLGDHLYGAGEVPEAGFTRPALHALSISLSLPSGERATYESSEPADFLAARERLRT